MMKHTLVLALLFYAAFAASTEEEALKAVEDAEDAPEEQVLAVADAVAEAPVDTEMAVEAQSSVCPNGWSFHGSHCFMFVNSLMSWFDAEAHCISLGGHLASAHSPGEYSFLQQLTKTEGQSLAWLGGFYLQGRWLWIDRHGMYYTNWYSQSSSQSYSCVYLRSTTGWANNPCTSTFRFICSKSPFSC